jgi:CheY-like chemotaxis protein
LVTPYPEDAQTLQRSLDGYVLQVVMDARQVKERTRDLFPRAILVTSDAGVVNTDDLPYELPIVNFNISRSDSGMGNMGIHLVKPISRQDLLRSIKSLGPNIHTILIVDDDPAMIRFVRQSIRAEGVLEETGGYDLLAAFTGAEGYEAVRNHVVDAILLDLELPDMHGLEWLAQLQRQPETPPIPIIIISAKDVPQRDFVPGKNVLELTLHRPLTINELGGVVKAVLENVSPQYPK